MSEPIQVYCKFCGGAMDETEIGEHYNWSVCAKNLKKRNTELEARNAVLKDEAGSDQNFIQNLVAERDQARGRVAELEAQVSTLEEKLICITERIDCYLNDCSKDAVEVLEQGMKFYGMKPK